MSIVNDCLTDILSWVESSKLKLNIDKAYLIIIRTKKRNKNIEYFLVKILGKNTSSLGNVRNVGVVFDNNYTFHRYLSQVS